MNEFGRVRKGVDRMACEIKYVGKYRNGKEKYWCLTHKEKASDKNGTKLKECLSPNKSLFDKKSRFESSEVQSIKIIFPNLLKSKSFQILMNGKEVPGVFSIGDSLIEPQNFIGLFLAKLNGIKLEKAICSHCGHLHNDNSLFAITPHRKHLCHYCGHEFFCKEANVGSEFLGYFVIPEIQLKKATLEIKETACVTYDILSGKVLVDDMEVDSVLIGKEKLEIQKWISQAILSNL